MKYEKTVLLVVFSAGVLVGNNLDFFNHDTFKQLGELTLNEKSLTSEQIVMDLKDGSPFGSEPDLVSSMQGCEVKSKLGCNDRVICTGFAEGVSGSKIELLMAQHKAKGVALNEAVQYTQSQSKATSALPAQDLQQFTIVGGISMPKDNLVAVVIGYNCK